jgi:hypothetical protein
MKNKIFIVPLLLLTIFLSCSPALDNEITIRSIALENVYVNILGKLVTIKPNGLQTIKYIPKGTYSYSTTYTVPSVANSSSVEGPATGTLTLEAGTKVSIFFASRLTQAQGAGSSGQVTYVLVASVSSNSPTTTGTGQ